MRIKVLLFISLFLLLSCRSNWDSRVGSYTYNNALIEHGPPDQSEIMSNGNKACNWTLARGAAWVDKLILVFDNRGILISGEEKRY